MFTIRPKLISQSIAALITRNFLMQFSSDEHLIARQQRADKKKNLYIHEAMREQAAIDFETW